MVYVAADGSVGGRKSYGRWLADFLGGIWTLLALFFTTIANPSAIEGHRSQSTSHGNFASRNGGRSYRNTGSGGQRLGSGGSNIRSVRDIGQANCVVGGG